MIHRTEPACQTPAWQRSLSAAITSLEALCRHVEIAPSELPFSCAAQDQFRMRIPVHYADLIEKGNPMDPLLLQVLPSGQELMPREGYHQDPVGDLAHQPVPGLIHKYRHRALIVATGACAIHCRYCFRRHFPYMESMAKRDQWRQVLSYLEKRPEISEVILSGGDPLTLADEILADLIEALAAIPHLERLRIHTRLPGIVPERVTGSLVRHLRGSRLTPVVVLHINHPREISCDVESALTLFREKRILLLNQSVLLKRVNDRADTLIELSEKLFVAGVLPYYLHMLDPVAGAGHFALDREEALTLHGQMLGTLPGYLVPRLVWEKPGAPSKLAVTT